MNILWLWDKLLKDNLESFAIAYQQNQDYHNTITKCINVGTEAETSEPYLLNAIFMKISFIVVL